MTVNPGFAGQKLIGYEFKFQYKDMGIMRLDEHSDMYAQCDLCLPDAQVRAQHCVLCVRGESLLVQTLDPGAPVFVNGERIEGEHRLQNNDALRLGRTTVRLVL